MKHKDVKDLLLKSPKTKSQYDDLKIIYDIKNTVINLRLELGLSQKELADKIGTKQSAISRLESGEYNPSIEFLTKVAKALNKTLKINFE